MASFWKMYLFPVYVCTPHVRMNLQISEEGIRSSMYALLTTMDLSFQPIVYFCFLLAPKLSALNSTLFSPVLGVFDYCHVAVCVLLTSTRCGLGMLLCASLCPGCPMSKPVKNYLVRTASGSRNGTPCFRALF